MSPLYTRRGDDGTTSQLGKQRLPKYHPRVEALGTLDEAWAWLAPWRKIPRPRPCSNRSSATCTS
jgi:cob(I)alamin adenosyltransferase